MRGPWGGLGPGGSSGRRSVGSDGSRYIPALDGLRALAIVAVFAYHLGYGWAEGGYLGVDLFFVLSGFLITTLLVEERLATKGIGLVAFWGRRARRLLPALLLMLVLVSLWVALESGGLAVDLGQVRGDALATVVYVANWHLLFAHQSYFDRFAMASPFKHTWSLAIEEQFYLVWPLVLVAVLALRRFWRPVGIALCVVGAALSAAWMGWLWVHGASVDRVYYGTDTRAFDLLVGAALAMTVVRRPEPTGRRATVYRTAALVGFGALLACMARAGTAGGNVPSFMFDGGLLACAVAAAALIAGVRLVDQGVLARLLSFAPVRYIGKISYGLYLWHWPVIVELTADRTGKSGLALAGIRVGAAFGLAVVSYHLVELPIRRWAGAGRRAAPAPDAAPPAEAGAPASPPAGPRRHIRHPAPQGVFARAALAPAAMGATCLAVVLATLPPSVATAVPSAAVRATSKAPGTHGVVGAPIALGTIDRAHPLRVLLLGDSVMLSESPAIEALLGSTGVVEVANHSQWGWGLSSQHDWRSEVAGWVRSTRPELVVAMWSWDNVVLKDHPVGYRNAIEAFVRELLHLGVRGLVLQQFPMPGADPDVPPTAPDYPTREPSLVDGWNRLAASLPAVFPRRVMYVPIGSSVLHDGHYATWLPPEGRPKAPPDQWTRVRQVDHIHFCPDGAARYAGALLGDLDRFYRLPAPSPTWWRGPWTTNYLAYRFPDAGVCPDDHP